MQRSFTVPEYVAELEKDVASIRDLYPHRITDIASLGRLYAAACAVLRGYTTNSKQEHQHFQVQFNWLLSNLHSEDSCNQPGTQKVMCNQKIYNKHLTIYLRRCRRHIEKEWENVAKERTLDEKTILNRRKVLLDGLFAVKADNLRR